MSIDEKTTMKTPSKDKEPLSNQAPANEARAAAETVAAAGKRGAETGAEIFQFSTKAVQRSMEQISSIFGLTGDGAKVQEAVHRSTRNLDAVMQCNTELVKGGQEITQIWLDGIQTRIRHNVANIEQLLGCRTLMEFNAVESDIVRQWMEDVMQNNVRLSETSVQIARAAVGSCHPSAS